EDRLRQLGVQAPAGVAPGVPPIDGDEEAVLRPARELARRCFALLAVALRAEGLSGKEALAQLGEAGLDDALGARERAFLEAETVDPSQARQFGWSYEAIW